MLEVVSEDVSRNRFKSLPLSESALLMFFNDFQQVFASESQDDIVTLWAIANQKVFITLRAHPVQTADILRTKIKSGRVNPSSTADLFRLVLDIREELLHQFTHQLLEQMEDLEEIIIRGNDLPEHETLGRIRIQCNKLRRYFSPELSALTKLGRHPPSWFSAIDHSEIIEYSEKLSNLVQEVNYLYERAKVLQDEQAAHIAEFNAKNLHVLSVMTVIFLPMTLITGIMGMNMEDLPGLKGSFTEVMCLMFMAGLFIYVALKLRKII
jgi:zinc transporter